MRMEFLLLVAAAFPSCSRRTDCDSSEDSLRDSPRGSPRDSSRDSPRDSSRDSSRSQPLSPPSPRLLPAPLVLPLPPEPGSPRIRCFAPRSFPGSTFELLQGTPGIPVGVVAAPPDQHWVDFSLPGAPRCYRCRYRSHNGSAWLESELSPGGFGAGGLVPGGIPCPGAAPEPNPEFFSPDSGDARCHPEEPGVTGAAPTAGTLRNGTGRAPGLALSGVPVSDPGHPPSSLPSRTFLAPPGLGRCRRPGAAAAAGGCGRDLARWEPGIPGWAQSPGTPTPAPGATGSVPHRRPAAAWTEPPGPGKAGPTPVPAP